MIKYLLYIFVVIIGTDSFAQNEFAAAAFYTDFKKVQSDAQNGFLLYKGAKKYQERGVGSDEFAVKMMLPLADSGKIIFPVHGDPYAEYFFQASKKKKDVDERAVNLREAVVTTFGKPLYTRTETFTNKKKIYSNTYYFTVPDTSKQELAIFSSHIRQQGGRYVLSFRIMGKR